MVSYGPRDTGDQRQRWDARGISEGLLPVCRMSSPLGLWDAPLLVSAALRGVPGPWGFPWEILLCAAMALFTVKSRSTLRSGAELAERCSAHTEVYRKVREKTGLMAQPLRRPWWWPVLPPYKSCAWRPSTKTQVDHLLRT